MFIKLSTDIHFLHPIIYNKSIQCMLQTKNHKTVATISCSCQPLMYSPLKLIQFFERGIMAKAALMPDRFFGHNPIHNGTNNIFYVLRQIHNESLNLSSSTSEQTTSRRL